jgi:hypothetical protein
MALGLVVVVVVVWWGLSAEAIPTVGGVESCVLLFYIFNFSDQLSL